MPEPSLLSAEPDCSLLLVGAATMLVQLGPFTVLTDPDFLHRSRRRSRRLSRRRSRRDCRGPGPPSARHTAPALRIADLTGLDTIVVSHLHRDARDAVTRRGPHRDVPIVTTPTAARTLGRHGFAAVSGLATWESAVLDRGGQRLTITATPGQHARGLARHPPPVMGSVFDYSPGRGRAGLRLYIGADTLPVERLREIPRRLATLDVAVLRRGGTWPPGALLATTEAAPGVELARFFAAGDLTGLTTCVSPGEMVTLQPRPSSGPPADSPEELIGRNADAFRFRASDTSRHRVGSALR